MENERRIITLLITAILSSIIMSCSGLGTSTEFQAQPNPSPACKSAAFDKSALIFESLLICGTNGVSADKLAHAANVAAEWLDNNEDGQVDEPRLLEAFTQSNPVVLMSANGMGIGSGSIIDAFEGHMLQDLWASETNPGGDSRDASQEEIHHIIVNAGWQRAFPDIFSEIASDNSILYQAWKLADTNAQYVYNDPTCNDSCKVTEFVYLATAAYMESGAEKDLASDEMRLKTRVALNENIPAITQIFEASDYVYPTNHWPDGNYPHQNNITFFGRK